MIDLKESNSKEQHHETNQVAKSLPYDPLLKLSYLFMIFFVN